MKFETVIIGGGLAGLTAAIELAERGIRTAIVSTGYSTLSFNTGSLGLLGYDGHHKAVDYTAPSFAGLAPEHPYSRIGSANITELAKRAKEILMSAGVKTYGSAERNHSRISPLGIDAPAWLTGEGIATIEKLHELKAKKVTIVGIDGFLDFYPEFIAASLEKKGFECEIKSVTTARLQKVRKSESEMRAPNISRVLTSDELSILADTINDAVMPGDADAILFPAVVGLVNHEDFLRLRKLSDTPLLYCATTGVSVPGIIIQDRLLMKFKQAGGTLFKGDTVTGASFDGKRLRAITTANLGDDELTADNFIFAAGSFISHGLKALPDRVVEPALGLDTDAPADRSQWFDKDLFAPQPYMKAGVATDAGFHAYKDGQAIENLYVAGSALSGADSLSEASGSGVAMLTAIHVAKSIYSSSN